MISTLAGKWAFQLAVQEHAETREAPGGKSAPRNLKSTFHRINNDDDDDVALALNLHHSSLSNNPFDSSQIRQCGKWMGSVCFVLFFEFWILIVSLFSSFSFFFLFLSFCVCFCLLSFVFFWQLLMGAEQLRGWGSYSFLEIFSLIGNLTQSNQWVNTCSASVLLLWIHFLSIWVHILVNFPFQLSCLGWLKGFAPWESQQFSRLAT